MMRNELIDKMAKDSKITKDKANQALQSLLDGIQEALSREKGKITLVGFGTFSRVHRKAREGVNPATGEKIKIEERNVVRFQAGKSLKEAVE